MNKRDLVSLVGAQLRGTLPPVGLDFVLVCRSLDSAGHVFFQCEGSRREIILPLIHDYLSAIDHLNKMDTYESDQS